MTPMSHITTSELEAGDLQGNAVCLDNTLDRHVEDVGALSSGVSSDEAPEASKRKVRMGKIKEGKKDKKKREKKDKGGEISECRGGELKSEEVAEVGADNGEDGLVEWEHDKQNPISKAEVVEYCPICGLPPEYCEFGESWDKCRPWVLEHYPELYPDLEAEPAVAATELPPSEAVKGKAGGGGKKSKPIIQQVTIQRVSRAKKKTATVVAGLDLFGVKLDKASKLFSKNFACGSSVIKGIPGQADQIEIQGDIEDALGDFITSAFKEISLDKLVFLRPK